MEVNGCGQFRPSLKIEKELRNQCPLALLNNANEIEIMFHYSCYCSCAFFAVSKVDDRKQKFVQEGRT